MEQGFRLSVRLRRDSPSLVKPVYRSFRPKQSVGSGFRIDAEACVVSEFIRSGQSAASGGKIKANQTESFVRDVHLVI